MKITFPRNAGQRYYDIHFRFMLNLFAELGWDVYYFEDDTGERGCFKMFMNLKPIMVDFSDYGSEYQGDLPCLRWHVKRDTQRDNIYPFTPASFWNWAQYREYRDKLKYRAEGLVMHNQRPHCNNTERRTFVRRMVEDWADKKLASGVVLPKGKGYVDGRELNGADTQYFGIKEYYWNALKDCLVSIHVPGQNNHMLDAAQLQLMAFGYCTISPYLPDILPFGMPLIAGVEYLECAEDYSNLKEVIDWCGTHRDECVQIGKNAKTTFETACAPRCLTEWLAEVEAKL